MALTLLAFPVALLAADAAGGKAQPASQSVQQSGETTFVWFKGRQYPLVELTEVRRPDTPASALARVPADPSRATAPASGVVDQAGTEPQPGESLDVVGGVPGAGGKSPVAPGAEARDFSFVFFQQDQVSFYGSDAQTWGTRYTLELPAGGVPVVTEIDWGLFVNCSDLGTTPQTYDPAVVLVEIYDTFDDQVNPIHSEYRGGIALSFGAMDPGDQIGGTFIVTPGFYFFDIGTDDTVFMSAYVGTIENIGGVDRFVEFPAQYTLCMGFGLGSDTQPSIGDSENAFCVDDEANRIYTLDDCWWWYGDDSYLTFTLRGDTVNDCNTNGYGDGDEVFCGFSENCFTGGGGNCICDNPDCTYYIGTDWLFEDPLGFGWVVPAVCDDIGDCVAGSNGVPDECDRADCNNNGVFDYLDICAGTSDDCQPNGVPDECEIAGSDCDNNGILDECEIAGGSATDCDLNGVPDSCQIDNGEPDCDGNGVLDVCERPVFFDCNRNGIEDYCDIHVYGYANDTNGDDIPDECPGEVCTNLWIPPVGGFEDRIFRPGFDIDGLDTDANGDAWSNSDLSCTTELDSTCSGSTKAIKNVGSDAAPGWNSTVWSEFFVGTNGSFPPPVPVQKIRFDYQVEGSLAPHFDHHIQLSSEGAGGTGLIMRWSSTLSDLGTNGPGPGDDATPGYVWIIDSQFVRTDTTVQVDLDTCHHVEVILYPVTQTVEVYIDGNLEFSGAPYERCDRFDDFAAATYTHFSGTPGGPSSTLVLDNFEVCYTGGAVDAEDCDSNGLDDLWEIYLGQADDCNGNFVLDRCESDCDDCDVNQILDSCEIAAGSATDSDGDGVLDICERADAAFTVDFEAFSTGDIDGQYGWWQYPNQNEYVGDAPPKFGPMTVETGSPMNTGKALKLGPAPPENKDYVGMTAAQMTGSPLYDMPEHGVEEWSAVVAVDPTTGFTSWTTFEITDFCAHGTAEGSSLAGLVDVHGVNTGVMWSPDPQLNGGADEYTMYTWGLDPVNPEHRPFQALEGQTTAELSWSPLEVNAVTIRIFNSTGLVEVVWNGKMVENAAGEIGYGDGFGADRQILLRTHQTDVTGWFDDITYSFDEDCDYDTLVDSAYITTAEGWGFEVDKNNDGIVDHCQDCDNDCTWTGPLQRIVSDISCLDPEEITGGAPDCNSNGIPDECDIDPSLPIKGSPGNQYHTRLGGGSSDCDNSTVPDECEYADEDCNNNGITDGCEIAVGSAADGDGDGKIDECFDCNNNTIADYLDIGGTSDDFIRNSDGAMIPDGIPDECCPDNRGADSDMDGDVDLIDYRKLQFCEGSVQGPTWDLFDPVVPHRRRFCGCADLNSDGVVDGDDLRLFQIAYSGP